MVLNLRQGDKRILSVSDPILNSLNHEIQATRAGKIVENIFLRNQILTHIIFVIPCSAHRST